MRAGRGVGHGKVLLFGEHAVVYGHPAIALAVDRCTEVTLTPIDGPTHVRSEHADPRVREAICRVLPDHGHQVEVETRLPVGRGMGSSAALAVALVRARADLERTSLGPSECYGAAMPIERAFHGNPSGVDVAVSAWGGCLWFRPGPPPERERLEPGEWQIVVLDSERTGNTAELVAQVAARRPSVDPVLERIGALTTQARAALRDPEALGELMSENQALLSQLGVCTPELNALVELARGAGALGAKLSGAGGGGIVISLVRDPGPVLSAAEQAGVPAFGCLPWVA